MSETPRLHRIPVAHSAEITLKTTEYNGPPSAWLAHKFPEEPPYIMVLRRGDIESLRDALSEWLEANP